MIGERIQQLRLSRGLTLTELSVRSGVAKSYLSAIERSLRKNPSIGILEKIAEVLDVPLQILLVLEEPIQFNESIQTEWIELVQSAIQAGITLEQFRSFIEIKRRIVLRDVPSVDPEAVES